MNPTKKQLQTVINNLEKVLPLAVQENHLDMMECRVNHTHKCGTVHCLGGWYAIATLDTETKLTYQNGTNRIQQDLGFDHEYGTLEWAENNPGIWGNDNGYLMFSSKSAFKSKTRLKGAENLQDIISHFKEVQLRL